MQSNKQQEKSKGNPKRKRAEEPSHAVLRHATTRKTSATLKAAVAGAHILMGRKAGLTLPPPPLPPPSFRRDLASVPLTRASIGCVLAFPLAPLPDSGRFSLSASSGGSEAELVPAHRSIPLSDICCCCCCCCCTGAREG